MRFKVKYGYSGGYLASIQDYTGNVLGPILWNLNLLDARFNAVSESYANGLWLQQGYDPLTGLALTRKAGTGGLDDNVQDLAYAWDDAGNLTSRQDLRQGLVESFSYDALDRLTATSGPGGGSLSLVYNAIGNVTSRSDVGSYSYHATKKHAAIAAGPNTYAYDANGNMTTRNGVTQSWTSYNLPASLSAGGYTAQFAYAPDRRRWRQVSSYANGTETTITVGGMVEKLTTAVRTHWKHRLPTPSGEVQVIRRSDGTNETLYLTTDHLGSTDAVLNASGAVLARMSFNATGARRSSGWTGSPSSAEWQAIADTTRRGYTGHEALDNVLLVHMNGRVYDPAIGRFMSADPYLDGADTTQGWNRYSYVHNNPLAYTDPSGYGHLPWGSVPRVARNDFGPQYSNGANSGDAEDPPVIVVTASRLDWDLFDSILALARADGRLAGGSGDGNSGNGGQPHSIDNDADPPPPDFLCSSSGVDGPVDAALGIAGNVGDVADSLLPAASLGSAVAAPSATGPALSTPWPDAVQFVGNLGRSALSTVGRVGQIGSAASVVLDLAQRDFRSAAFTLIDAGVYTMLGGLAATGVTTAGSTTAAALTAASIYFASGGSQGAVQQLCGQDSR